METFKKVMSSFALWILVTVIIAQIVTVIAAHLRIDYQERMIKELVGVVKDICAQLEKSR